MLGVDDFALRRRHRYATILIDAQTRRRVDVLPERGADALEAWLRAHPGVEVVCRDRSGAYAEAVTRVLPDAAQVADRWHLWHNLAEAARQGVAAHSACWAKAGPPPAESPRATTTRQRWHQVHDLLDQGVGLLDCARRFNLALNTVKRYARAPEPDRVIQAPAFRPTLVDPYRDYLKGRLDGDRPPMSARRLTRLLLTRPDRLTDGQRALLDRLTDACPEMSALEALVRGFAALLTPAAGNDDRLTDWITSARAAVDAGLTLPFHNGGTEGVNTTTKKIMRQMHGRAGFTLLRHRILLG